MTVPVPEPESEKPVSKKLTAWNRTDMDGVPWAVSELEMWTEEAMREIVTELIDDDPPLFVADAIGCDGAWGDGDTEAEAIACLRLVLFDWAWLMIEHDGTVPVKGGIDPNGVDISPLRAFYASSDPQEEP